MSYLVIDVMAEYTDRTTGNRQIRAELCADTAADLPANTTALMWLLGSHAKAVDTGKEYWINSTGTWIEQPSNNAFDNVYTKAETDAIISPMQSDIDTQESSLSNLIDMGGKNILKLTDTATTTKQGVTLTYNGDGTYTIDSGGNPSTGADYFYLARTSENPVFPENSVISGCTGGTDSTYRLQLAGTTIYQTDSPVTLAADTSGSLIFYFAAGQTFDNMILSPMICKKSDFDISPEFVPSYYNQKELYLRKASLAFTPSTIAHLLNCTFSIPDSTRTLRFTVGKLNSTQNYLQIYVNGVDKGYIVFDVSRNIDNWGE